METYRVRWVIDGNTIQALSQTGRIRKLHLAGVIAPNLSQPLGETSKQVLERCLPKGIYIQVLVIGRDAENALLVEVNTTDELINEKLVRLGLALVSLKQINQLPHKDKILEAEKFAKQRQLGIHATTPYSHISDHYYIWDNSTNLTNQIPQVCREKGLTTAYQLAVKCGIQRTTAYRLWDNPEAYPTRKTMMKLCQGLGVEPGQILALV